MPRASHDLNGIPKAFAPGRTRLFVGLVLNGAAQAGAAIATALLVHWAFDQLITGSAPAFDRRAAWIGGGLTAAAAVGAFLRLNERVTAERLGQSFVHDVRLALYQQLTRIAPRALQNRRQGGVLLRFVGDLTSLRQWISLGLSRLLVAGTMAAGALAAVAFVSRSLALLLTVILALGTAAAVSLGKRLFLAAVDARKFRTRIAANMNEKIGSLAVVQLFGQRKREGKRIARQSERLKDAMVHRAAVVGKLRVVIELTAGLATTGALLLGAREVAAGRITPGAVVAAMTITGLLAVQMRDLGRVQEYWQSYRVSLGKIHSFMATPTLVEEKPNAPDLVAGAGQLVFEAATLEGSIADFSATAPAGEVTAIIGPNGAGKSTLLALAARLLDPDSGAVRLDDQVLSEHNLASIRRAIGVVGPDLPLLRGSLRRNLTYRWPKAPAEEIERVRKLCGLDEVISALPEGEETRVNEGGQNLSTGQRQRLALARAILGSPKLLLLDEADANLDSAAADCLNQIIAQYDGTVLLVTHRADRLAAADNIWFVENGHLREAGHPDFVLRADGPASAFLHSAPAPAALS